MNWKIEEKKKRKKQRKEKKKSNQREKLKNRLKKKNQKLKNQPRVRILVDPLCSVDPLDRRNGIKQLTNASRR